MRNYDLQTPRLDLTNPVDEDIFGRSRMDDELGAMNKIESHDEDTKNSGSWSGLSDLSADATDDFGRRLIQHHRDEKRLRDASRQPFRKAMPRPRIAEAILREERERDRQVESPDHQRTGSSGSNTSDPPVTIPKEWGRRARRQRDWMKKIVEPDTVETGDAHLQKPDLDENAIWQHKTAFTGDAHWRTDEPVTPSSLRHMNTTFHPSATPEDNDFTSVSLLASTPAPPRPRQQRKIDELTRREIEDIERQAHTSHILDEMDQRSPNGSLRRTSSNPLRERAMSDERAASPSKLPRPVTAPTPQSPSPSRIPRHQRSPHKDKENTQPNGDTKVAKHNRQDSMNLLRKLARVSSMSPRPKSPNGEPAQVKAEVPVDIANKNTEPQKEQAARSISNGSWGAQFEGLVAQEPVPSVSTIPEPQQPPAKSALEDIMREKNEQYGESTIQSLEDIVHPNVDPTDPTITFDFDTAAAAAAAANESEQQDDHAESLTQEQKDRRQEDLAMEGLNKHLRAAHTSIKDASRGLRRVENRIEAAQESHQAAPVPTPSIAITPLNADSNGFTHCAVCGGGYHSVWLALWVEFRSLFYTWDSAARFRVRFTWLGAWCLGWLIWYLLESLTCEFYCTPQYAYPGMRFPAPGIDTPRFPFAIPMTLLQPWREYWAEGLDALRLTVETYLYELTHEMPLDSGVPPLSATVRMPFSRTHGAAGSKTWASVAAATSVRVAQSLMDAVDEVGSMWDDEAWS